MEIVRLVETGSSGVEISCALGVHRSTVSGELWRGSWQPERDHANLLPCVKYRLNTRGPRARLYLGPQAQLQADSRATRSHLPYRMTYDGLVDWVIEHLRRGWTPQEIAGLSR